jgi:hypothetical protein
MWATGIFPFLPGLASGRKGKGKRKMEAARGRRTPPACRDRAGHRRIETMRTIIVTRHPALVALLQERGLVPAGAEVIPHVESPDSIRGCRVIGVLPLHLAASAAEVVEVPLSLSPEDRGKELSIERLRDIAGAPRRYRVVRLEEGEP